LYGAHARLQQSPPHDGTPPSFTEMPPSGVTPPHTAPATKQPVVPGAAGALHVPSVAPAALPQMPPQHSRSFEHASPFCMQNEPPAVQDPL
jgi:hypothetical protein